jgi:cell division protein ZapE
MSGSGLHLSPSGESPLSLAAFAVPPRFSGATFVSYRPDPAHPSQAAAREQLRSAVATLDAAARHGGLLGRLRRRGSQLDWRGLYLDGSFGVGKTHLLAAAYHAAGAGVPRAYLSFQDLTYVVGERGMARVLELFARARLICLDEFELDDPGNTMLAASFVRGVLERDARVIVTSNTLPDELGQGRFNADEFQREIGQLSTAFATLRITGEDYRHRHFGPEDALPRLLPATACPWLPGAWSWDALLTRLAALHPAHYAGLIAELPALAVCAVEPIGDQDTALRFVHFVDKLYDRCTPLLLSTDHRLPDLFPSSYGYGPFKRKFARCRSRLHEMLADPLPAATLERLRVS